MHALDERLGFDQVTFCAAERRELERQIDANEGGQLDPDLLSRGRTWAERMTRPLNRQRALVATYIVLLSLTTAFFVLGLLGYPSWGGAAVGCAALVSSEIKRRVVTRQAQVLLATMPDAGHPPDRA